jgi:hypothetical protein
MPSCLAQPEQQQLSISVGAQQCCQEVVLHGRSQAACVCCRYDFTDGDLGVSLTQMRMFLDEYADIPFRVLRFLVTEINYGGRVTDDKDRRLISNLVSGFVGPQVLDPGYKFSSSGTPATIQAPCLTF